MSGAFDATWLALREPADHASRDTGLVRTLSATLAGRDRPVEIVDLGCGTGSNLRALAPNLPAAQAWRLVDHDAALLAAARQTLAGWADRAEEVADGLVLTHGLRRIAVSFRLHDLAADIAAPLEPAPDLVTAAALFDLVSTAAIGRLATAAAASGAVFYTALTYDGREDWHPPHPADPAVQAAFLADLARDKGFGPAAGPRATDALTDAFGRVGYAVTLADSPWRIDEGTAALRRALAEGKAGAAAGQVPAPDLAAWLASRRAGGTATIGHQDLLAMPR